MALSRLRRYRSGRQIDIVITMRNALSLYPFGAACALTFFSSAALAQELTITNARIIDGTGNVIERGAVIVTEGRIESVAAGQPAASSGRVIDAAGKTVLPGFIESHRHPIGGGAEWLASEAPARMQEFLDAGFTTMLSAGDDINTAMELRSRIDGGRIQGPRLIVLGRVPTARPAAGGGGAPRIDPARSDRSREPRVEAQHAQFVHARRRDSLRLVAKAHEPRGRSGRLEMLLRLGLEADHGRRQPQLAAAFPECRQDRLVPEMQAVEVADGHRAPRVRVTTGLETTSNQHGPAVSGDRAKRL